MTEANLERFYGSLDHYVKMVVQDHSNLLILDAEGGLGKTHNVIRVLEEELPEDKFLHLKGFTTPRELYRTLWQAREDNTILFLDDMGGITSNSKAIEMLKSATDTQGEENVVEYRTSRAIPHPSREGAELPNTFTFRGRLIMSFNDTPDNRHFDALKDRGSYYELDFDYEERIDLIHEIAKIDGFSNLLVSKQKHTASWIETVTNPAYNVSIRSLEEICQMRHYAQDNEANWQKMALDVFGLDYDKWLITKLREEDMSVEEQIAQYKAETGKSKSQYYEKLDQLRQEWSVN